jgi:hypothetical protein
MAPHAADIEFTNHATERMQLRAITEDMVLKTIQHPDRSYLEDDGDTKFIREVDGVQLHVVCKPLPEQGKWLVKSTWVRGEDDQGNRVDRQGHVLGKRRRAAPQPAQYWVWIVILIVFVAILLYLLSR